ncbi:MAG: 3-deoxy-D-manno-octulosonic acid transferase [Acidobacteriota bacterium]|jgi:3-deoxy-D-manno-octulosonic-acid transferase|nr:3-deoxy-D-manno-octulosonic acid transferase [Acidobacteriota bacterium]
MYLLYSLLLVFWGAALTPAFLYKAWRRGKRLPGTGQRFGRLPERLRGDGSRAVVWFHACSVGETLSLAPLVRAMRDRLPEARFVFSTVTPTGQAVAAKSFGAENVFYFPIDFAFAVRRVLGWLRPSLVVIIDTEIWPNLLRQAQRRGTPVAMANGRISPASFRHYRLARPVLRRVFGGYAALMMQSDEDAGRITALGAPPEKVSTPGNLKFDSAPGAGSEGASELRRELEEGFGLGAPGDACAAAPLIVAGSTHPGEERILLEALGGLRKLPGLEGTRMLLAPRHPERFDEVAAAIAAAGFAFRRRSQKGGAPAIGADGAGRGGEAPVLLLDTLGELSETYRYADIVFVGGSLTRRGGHSVLEPAAFAKAIVVGPSMENFRAVRDGFAARKALAQVTATEDDRAAQAGQLVETFRRLLQDDGGRKAMGEAARRVLEENRGAAGRIADKLTGLMR